MENKTMNTQEFAAITLQQPSSGNEHKIGSNVLPIERCVREENETTKMVGEVKKIRAKWTLPIPPPLPPKALEALKRRQQREEQQKLMEVDVAGGKKEATDEKSNFGKASPKKISRTWNLPIPPPLPPHALERIRRRQLAEKQKLMEAQPSTNIVKYKLPIAPPLPPYAMERFRRRQLAENQKIIDGLALTTILKSTRFPRPFPFRRRILFETPNKM